MLFYFTPNPMESTAWFKVKLDNNFVVKLYVQRYKMLQGQSIHVYPATTLYID